MSPPLNVPPNDIRRMPTDEVDYGSIFSSAPTVVGRYQLGRRLGMGRLGPCHEAWHLERQREAVVKLVSIDASEATRAQAVAVMLDRLQPLATLRHPMLVSFGDAGPTAEGIYIAVEAAPGRSLEAALASGWRPDLRDALALGGAIAQTLAFAHAQGIAHGNLHAGQVLLDASGLPQLTDLGLLPAVHDLLNPTVITLRPADLAAIAPEVRAGGPPSMAADVHAFGVLLLRLLVAEDRFQAIAREQLRSAPGAEWPPLLGLVPDAPPALEPWLQRALSSRPADRPLLVGELPSSLALPAPHVNPPGPKTRGTAADEPPPGNPRRWWAVGAVTVLVLVLAGGLAAWLVQQRAASRTEAALTPPEPTERARPAAPADDPGMASAPSRQRATP